MGPSIRLKGPKFTKERVSLSSECLLNNQSSQTHKLNVLIRLDPLVLAEMDDIDDDMYSLDFELNQALKEKEGKELEEKQPKKEAEEKIEQNTQETQKTVKDEPKEGLVDKNKPQDVFSPHYRPIPKNIVPILESELCDMRDDEDLGIIDKLVFSIKDPLSAVKITLPVKARGCSHFQCFDYETFCLFNKIPTSIKNFARKDIAKKSFEKLAYYEKKPYLKSSLKIIIPETTRYPRAKNLPSYRCPICDLEFHLPDLCLSSSFNYFVKSTSKDTEKIEIVDMNKYRILESSSSVGPSGPRDEMIVITDDDDDDDDSDNENDDNNDNDDNDTTDVFEDGLDDDIVGLSEKTASGNWDDPITLD